MENDEQHRIEFQKHFLRMKSESHRANENMRRFFDNGDPNDLDSLVSWMHFQFLKPTIDRLGHENSRAGLEQMLAQLQTQPAKFRESSSSAINPNQKKFIETWNDELANAISQVKNQLSKLPGLDCTRITKCAEPT